MPYDLLIKGSHVLDPGQGIDERLDIAITGGRIVALRKDIAEAEAAKTLQIRGPDRHVVPGLIDSWLTGYRRVGHLSPPDETEIWTFIMFRRLLLLAWIGSHQGVDIAVELGAGYTQGTCDLAESFLSSQ